MSAYNNKILINNFNNYIKKKDKKFFNKTKNIINNIKKKNLDSGQNFILIRNFEKNPKIIKKKIILFSKMFGTICSQNKSGKKILEVKPDISKIKKLSQLKQKKKIKVSPN